MEIRDVLRRAYEYGIQYVDKGVVANYIPELAKEDKTKAGAALIDKNGSLYDVGTSQHKFSIQSIVKIIIYLCVLEHYDFDYIQKFIGVKPSAKPFNSIIALELSEKNTFEMILNRTRDIIGNDKIDYSRSVFNSESSSAFANRALTYMLLNGKIIPSNVNVDDLLNVYFKSCSILADVRDLAQLGFILSRDGKDGENKQRLSGEHARILRTLMVTCGTYDYSGEFAIKIGLPAKSGVGGGIVTASKAGYGIGVYCPGLDSHGNSYVGTRILEFLSRELNLNIY